MSSAPFEIKVVYDSSRRKRRGAVVRTASARVHAAPARRLALVGLLNLLIAGAMYYVTWWQADSFIYLTLIKKMPLDMPREFAANPFGIRSLPSQSVPDALPAEPESQSIEPAHTGPRWSGKEAQVIIPATAYGWLVLATAGTCAVALAGGAWVGAAGGRLVRIWAQLGGLALLCSVLFFGWKIWAQYGAQYKVGHIRIGMGLLALMLGLLGLALADGVRWITKLAGVIVIVAAIATAVGMWLWVQTGAMDSRYATWPMLAAGFGIHAIWGVVLFLSAPRLRV